VSGVLTTGGGLAFTGYTDGTFAAYDDATLEQLWKMNVGTGLNAPPITFEAGGKQYVAILSGLTTMTPVHATMPGIFVTEIGIPLRLVPHLFYASRWQFASPKDGGTSRAFDRPAVQ
jgi:outer membrane protein assembly factor BamB